MTWFFTVRRDFSVLFCEMMCCFQTKKLFKDTFDLDFGFDYVLIDKEGVFYDLDEKEKAEQFFLSGYEKEGVAFVEDFIAKLYACLDQFEQGCLPLIDVDYSSFSDEDLTQAIEQFKHAYSKGVMALYAPNHIQILCDTYILPELQRLCPKHVSECLSVLTSPIEQNESTADLVAFYSLVVEKSLGKDISRGVLDYIKEFGWMNTRGFVGEEWDVEEILKRVEEVDVEHAKEKVAELKALCAHNKEETEKILSRYAFSEQFTELVWAAKKYTFFRTHRMDTYVKYGFMMRPLFKEIGKRVSVSIHDLFYLTSSELKAFISGVDQREKISERKKGVLFLGEKGTGSALVGEEMEQYKKEHLSEDCVDGVSELKGNVACGGKVEGRVSIVLSKEDVEKVRVGDVLIASMTLPAFLPAMEKASGFVTDEGGITCHAAIVAREMKKPCLIGTKHATKVFRDGDKVVLDCVSGVVKKV